MSDEKKKRRAVFRAELLRAVRGLSIASDTASTDLERKWCHTLAKMAKKCLDRNISKDQP